MGLVLLGDELGVVGSGCVGGDDGGGDDSDSDDDVCGCSSVAVGR